MKYRLIFDRSQQVMATAEMDQQFHVLTNTTYEVFDTTTSERIAFLELAFIPTYVPPKKLPNVKVRSLNNTLHLGSITRAQFANGTLYIATSKGNVLEVDPRTQYILNVIRFSDESIRDFVLTDAGNLVVATANSVVLYTEQRTLVDVAVSEPLRLYSSKKLPIPEKLASRDITNLCLVQTADELGCLAVVNGELRLSLLFRNTFYQAVDLPELGMIIAINAHKRIAAYGYNGKCYGKCEFAFKPRSFQMLQNGGFICYTYDDRLVQVFMKIIDNGKRVEFLANGLSSPRIQAIISTSCNRDVLDYLEEIFEEKRPEANLFVGNKYVCVGRAHSAAIVDFSVYMLAASENPDVQKVVPKSQGYYNSYEYLIQGFKSESDVKVEDAAFVDALKIVADDYKPQADLISQCKNKLQAVIRQYEDVFPDIVPDSILDMAAYEEAVDEAVTYMESMQTEACDLVKDQFPKEVQGPGDVVIDLFNLQPSVLKHFIESFDENEYLKAREKCLEKMFSDLKQKVEALIEARTKVERAEVPEVVEEEKKKNRKRLPDKKPEDAQHEVIPEPELLYLKEQADKRREELIEAYVEAYAEIIANTRAANMKIRLQQINEGLRQMNSKLDEFDFHLNRYAEGITRYEEGAVLEREFCQQISDENERKNAYAEFDSLQQQNKEALLQDAVNQVHEEVHEFEETSENNGSIPAAPAVASVAAPDTQIEIPKFSKLDPLCRPQLSKLEGGAADDMVDEGITESAVIEDNEDSFDKALDDVKTILTEEEAAPKLKKVAKKEKRSTATNEQTFIDIFDVSSPDANAESTPSGVGAIITEPHFLHCFKSALLAREAIYSTIVREKHLNVYNQCLEDAFKLIFLYLPDCCIVDSRFVLLPTAVLNSSAWGSLLCSFDLKLHEFCSAKEVPSNLSGRQFIRNFRALSHRGLLSFLGCGFSVNNSFYVFTQEKPQLSLLDVLNGTRVFKTEQQIKKFILELLRTIDFLNSGDIKLLHRDLRPSQIWVDIEGDDILPKVYHIGFMHVVNGKEPSEVDTMFAAPEVVCGGVTPSSDVWSVGTVCFKLLEQLVGVKTKLFTPGPFNEKSKDLPEGYSVQEANNAWIVAQMVEHAKDVQEISKSRVLVMKENFKEQVLKEAKVPAANAKQYAPAFGILPWDAEERGILREPKNNCLAKLYKKVDSDALDFIQRCWCFMPSKRQCARDKIEHKWFTKKEEE